MSNKFNPDKYNVIGNNLEQRTNSKIEKRLFGGINNPSNSQTRFVDVPLKDVTPRSINNYSQSRIERLAQSIRSTNNRLIHPIILVKPEDLPEGHEVLKAYEEQGIDVKKIKYILVAGERRYRAMLLNYNQEQEKIKNNTSGLIISNPFEKITANILTKEEAQNEEAFYKDSNDEARQLTPIEGILHIQDALKEINTDKKKRDALIEMNGGNKEGIPDTDYLAAKQFNTAEYVSYYLENELGITGWTVSTIKKYLSIVNNCPKEVVDAILDNKVSSRAVRDWCKYPSETQKNLLDQYINYPDKYVITIEKLKKSNKKKSSRITYKDAQKVLASLEKNTEKSIKKLKVIQKELGENDKKETQEAIDECNEMIKIIKERIENLK